MLSTEVSVSPRLSIPPNRVCVYGVVNLFFSRSQFCYRQTFWDTTAARCFGRGVLSGSSWFIVFQSRIRRISSKVFWGSMDPLSLRIEGLLSRRGLRIWDLFRITLTVAENSELMQRTGDKSTTLRKNTILTAKFHNLHVWTPIWSINKFLPKW